MKKQIAQLLTGTTEFALLAVVVGIVVTSFFVASQIKPTSIPDKVLGLNSIAKPRNFKASINSNIQKIQENDAQINFELLSKFNGSDEVVIDLGKLTNLNTTKPQNFRINFQTAEIYQKDFNAYLQIEDQDYDLLINGTQYNNDVLIPQGTTTNCKLKLIPNNPLYFQVESSLIIYK